MSENVLPIPEENQKQKTYVIGTISIDAEGVFHVHYVGPYKIGRARQFGNWVESSLSVTKLLQKMGVRFLHAKQIYLNKIGSLSDDQDGASSN